MVTTPLQVVHPPVCGPPRSSSARFHFTTDSAQLRVARMIRRMSWYSVVSNGVTAHAPELHSVTSILLSGKLSCTPAIASGVPA